MANPNRPSRSNTLDLLNDIKHHVKDHVKEVGGELKRRMSFNAPPDNRPFVKKLRCKSPGPFLKDFVLNIRTRSRRNSKTSQRNSSGYQTDSLEPIQLEVASDYTKSYPSVHRTNQQTFCDGGYELDETVASVPTSRPLSTPDSRAILLGSPSPSSPPPNQYEVDGCGLEIEQQFRQSNAPLGMHNEVRIQRTRETTESLAKVATGNRQGQSCMKRCSYTSNSASKRVSFTLNTSYGTSSDTKGSQDVSDSLPLGGDDGESDDEQNGDDSPIIANEQNPGCNCPWEHCTVRVHLTRLKEHIRRKHIYPFMCNRCERRFGDKAQTMRHLKKAHPPAVEDNEIQEQSENILALYQHVMLKPRGISYDRIAAICQAASIDELPQPLPALQFGTASNPTSPDTSSPTSIQSLQPDISNEFDDPCAVMLPYVMKHLNINLLSSDSASVLPNRDELLDSYFESLKQHTKNWLNSNHTEIKTCQSQEMLAGSTHYYNSIAIESQGSIGHQPWGPDNFMPGPSIESSAQPHPPSLVSDSTARSPRGDMLAAPPDVLYALPPQSSKASPVGNYGLYLNTEYPCVRPQDTLLESDFLETLQPQMDDDFLDTY
ncbi:hypothetical protein EDC01DRAFT_629670 [Geopyxis carbonaria]|nr:hypothetical protein EDC01DRAFT_629670 [Geopyxis carbonaria]